MKTSSISKNYIQEISDKDPVLEKRSQETNEPNITLYM